MKSCLAILFILLLGSCNANMDTSSMDIEMIDLINVKESNILASNNK